MARKNESLGNALLEWVSEQTACSTEERGAQLYRIYTTTEEQSPNMQARRREGVEYLDITPSFLQLIQRNILSSLCMAPFVRREYLTLFPVQLSRRDFNLVDHCTVVHSPLLFTPF